MASLYTTNTGLEKIEVGQASGTWGTKLNLNFDLIDQSTNGLISVTLPAVGTSGSPNALAITNEAVSDGRNIFIEFVDGGDLGGTAYVQLTPNDAEKLCYVRNSLSGSQSILIFQGNYNASNDYELVAGADAVLKFSGTGVGATVTDVFTNLTVTALTATTYNGLPVSTDSTQGIVELANQSEVDAGTDTDRAVTPATLANYANLGSSTLDGLTNVTITANSDGELLRWNGSAWINNTLAEAGAAPAASPTFTGTATFSGATIADLGTVTTADIDGGTIDATAIGGGTPAAGAFTTLSASGALTASAALSCGAEIIETVYAISGTTPELDPADGTIQTWTLSGNSTPTDVLATGESITIKILDGTAYTIDWTSVLAATEWVGGAAPTLDTSGSTWVVLWNVGGTVYGTSAGATS